MLRGECERLAGNDDLPGLACRRDDVVPVIGHRAADSLQRSSPFREVVHLDFRLFLCRHGVPQPRALILASPLQNIQRPRKPAPAALQQGAAADQPSRLASQQYSSRNPSARALISTHRSRPKSGSTTSPEKRPPTAPDSGTREAASPLLVVPARFRVRSARL